MGTNYYLHIEPCPCCGNPGEEIHLGKSSCGWKFLFRKSKYVYDYDSFCKFIKTGTIRDEYGDKRSNKWLIGLIKTKQEDKEHPDAEHIYGYDFLDCDFC